MSHNYNYRIGGTALVPTYADRVRVIEGISGKRAELLEVAYRHGLYVADRHWSRARMMRLEAFLPGDTADAAYTSIQGIVRLLTGTPYLQRNDPNAGEVRTKVLLADEITQQSGPARFVWPFPIWQLDGSWEANTASSEVDTGMTTTGTIGPFTVGGSHPAQPVFTITCTAAGSNPKLTHATTGDELLLSAAYSTSDVIVIDCYSQTVTLNGTRDKGALKLNRGYWFELAANTSHTINFASSSGTWSVTTEWRNRWRI